jgi:universal stress protein F
MYKSIVIAAALFNNGQTTRDALKRAQAMLDDGGTVTLVHVMEDVPGYVASAIPSAHLSSRRAEVTEDLAAIAAEFPDLKSQTFVRNGQPAGTILEVAAEVGGDLIMIASHKPGLSDFFIGSTAARVVRHAPVSVLVSR